MSTDSLKICDNPILAKYGYRKIRFAKHKFVMLYRIQNSTVIVDGMFHELQDYEGVLADELHLQQYVSARKGLDINESTYKYLQQRQAEDFKMIPVPFTAQGFIISIGQLHSGDYKKVD